MFHIHFEDDTLIVGERSWSNIIALKAIFLLFELVVGLEVNFLKSSLSWVSIFPSLRWRKLLGPLIVKWVIRLSNI